MNLTQVNENVKTYISRLVPILPVCYVCVCVPVHEKWISCFYVCLVCIGLSDISILSEN